MAKNAVHFRTCGDILTLLWGKLHTKRTLVTFVFRHVTLSRNYYNLNQNRNGYFYITFKGDNTPEYIPIRNS